MDNKDHLLNENELELKANTVPNFAVFFDDERNSHGLWECFPTFDVYRASDSHDQERAF